jgi:hypothetical protein
LSVLAGLSRMTIHGVGLAVTTVQAKLNDSNFGQAEKQ